MCAPLFRSFPLLLALWLPAMTAAAAPAPFGLLHSLHDPGTNAQPGTEHGWSVAIDGSLVVVGAPGDSVAGQFSGLVKIYHAVSGALLHTLTNPSPAVLDNFGWCVAISGQRVVVGAPYDDEGGTDSGVAYVFDLAGATPTVPVAVLHNPTPAANDLFGNAVAISGARLVIGAPQDDAGTNDSGLAYLYDLNSATPALPFLTLTNPTPATNDNFGWSVAISDARVVVGAYRDDAGRSDGGAAYVYDLVTPTPLVPVLSLTNPVTAGGSFFGYTVGISGTRAVVGTPRNDFGAVYIYDLVSAAPAVPVVTLANPNGGASDSFGRAVAISGSRMVVGAQKDTSGGSSAGVVFAYDLSGATPALPVATLAKAAPSAFDFFGTAVAISGTRVAVGTPKDDIAGTDAGSAYVFDLASATPGLPLSTLASPTPALDSFGWSMAVSGTRVVVGVPTDNTGAGHAGKALVYDLASATPTRPVITLFNPLPSIHDEFGWSVAIAGTRVVVGAFHDGTTPGNTGIAYVYDLGSATPGLPVLTLTNPTPATSAFFGNSVAISGARVVIGAPQDSTGAFYTGKAHVFDLASATPGRPILTLTNPAPAAYDSFGHAVAISGTRVVVGAFQDDAGTNDAGSAYVFDLASATPRIPSVILTNPAPFVGDNFGHAVAIAGTRVVIGAFSDDLGATNDAGTAYVFDLTGPTPAVPVATLCNPSATPNDLFGFSVSISGTRVVVGALGEDRAVTNAGVAYVYDLASASPAEPVATLTSPAPAAGDFFGYAVAVDADTIVAGAPHLDSTPPDRGGAYVYIVLPTLHIVPAGPGVATVSWTPTNAAGFMLQHTDSLSPTGWTNAPGGAMNPATISTTNLARFYRVAHP